MINLYSDDCQSALKYLKNIEVNIQNMLIIAGDFNIRDSDWDLSYPFHSIHTDSLLEIVNSFDPNLSCSIQKVPICYSNNIKLISSFLDWNW